MLAEDLQNDGIKVRHVRFPGMCAQIEGLQRLCDWIYGLKSRRLIT
jgi:hypothetical protein